MALHSNGVKAPGPLLRAGLDVLAWLRSTLLVRVVVKDGRHRSVFLCSNRLQAYRAMTLWIKEQGTMNWIERDVRAGDVFLDIGANVGLYTIAAAHRVGPEGHVFALEPHKPSMLSLLENIAANDMGKAVSVIAIPVSDTREVAQFNYTSLSPSVTGSQFGSTFKDGTNKAFRPSAQELCVSSSVDELVAIGAIRPFHHAKIDVDGIELKILMGMKGQLTGPSRPRTVQVELNVGQQDQIIGFMASCGYALAERHFTLSGQKQLAKGIDTSKITHNAIFTPDAGTTGARPEKA